MVFRNPADLVAKARRRSPAPPIPRRAMEGKYFRRRMKCSLSSRTVMLIGTCLWCSFRELFSPLFVTEEASKKKKKKNNDNDTATIRESETYCTRRLLCQIRRLLRY